MQIFDRIKSYYVLLLSHIAYKQLFYFRAVYVFTFLSVKDIFDVQNMASL